jgi:hypothetical protein
MIEIGQKEDELQLIPIRAIQFIEASLKGFAQICVAIWRFFKRGD